jgi:hypothetical protein
MASRIIPSDISQAVKLEKKALELRKKAGDNGEEIGELYEMAGNLRRASRDDLIAIDDYSNAKKFGYAYNKEKTREMDKNIDEIRRRGALVRRRGALVRRIEDSKFTLKKGYAFAILSIASLLAALGFVSLSLTGNAIGGLPQENSKWVGLCFFICGLVFSFIYLKGRK